MADVSVINFGDNIDRDVKDAVIREKMTVVDPSAGAGLITFGVDANGNYGYKKVGADTVTPFKTGGGDLSFNYSKPSKSFSMYEHSLSSLYQRGISPGNYEGFTLSNPMSCKQGNILIITVISTVRTYMTIGLNSLGNNDYFTLLNSYSLDIGGTGSSSNPVIASISYIFKVNYDVNLNNIYVYNTSGTYGIYIYGRLSSTGH